jgi:hypothetical protein
LLVLATEESHELNRRMGARVVNVATSLDSTNVPA